MSLLSTSYGRTSNVGFFLTQVLDVPTWKWEYINIYFIIGLPQARRQTGSIWVIVDRMMKPSHFIPMKSTYSVDEYATLYLNEIASLHGIHLSIIFYRGAQCTSRFWRSFKNGLFIQVKVSTNFHIKRMVK